MSEGSSTCDRCDARLDPPHEDGELGVTKEIDNWDLPNTYVTLCLSCATDDAMDDLGTDDRDEALQAVLGAIAGR